MLPDLVIFDFDGTMLRDDGVVLAAYRRALTANDIPFTEADLAARRGAAKWAVFRELAGRPTRSTATDQLAERALANFESALREEYTRGEVASIEGAESSARWLAERGAKIALSSGFDRGLVELLVERLGWEKLFDRVLAAEDAPAGRPAPYLIFRAMIDLGVHDLARVAVVGDTPLDLDGQQRQSGLGDRRSQRRPRRRDARPDPPHPSSPQRRISARAVRVISLFRL